MECSLWSRAYCGVGGQGSTNITTQLYVFLLCFRLLLSAKGEAKVHHVLPLVFQKPDITHTDLRTTQHQNLTRPYDFLCFFSLQSNLVKN